MRVLLLEDDEKISSLMSECLSEAGFHVDGALDGERALELIDHNLYDVVILDLMVPKVDGHQVLAKIRNRGLNVPILIVSAKTSVDEKVQAFKSGADDYITKPFSMIELLARVEALVRRSSHQSASTKLVVGEVNVDLMKREVTRAGKKIDLQTKEFALLEYFAKNPDIIVPKAIILETVWGYNFDPQTNVVDVLVCRLRNKIDKGFKTKMIQTRRGVGYIFKSS